MNKTISTPNDSGRSAALNANAKPTILIVDDDRRFARTLEDSFSLVNINTLVAHDGDAGLAIALCRKPDLMLLDTRMPRRSGYLVLEYLATQEDLIIPTVMMSENEGQRHETYGRMLGAIDFLKKPVNSSEVVALVTGLLESKLAKK